MAHYTSPTVATGVNPHAGASMTLTSVRKDKMERKETRRPIARPIERGWVPSDTFPGL